MYYTLEPYYTNNILYYNIIVENGNKPKAKNNHLIINLAHRMGGLFHCQIQFLSLLCITILVDSKNYSPQIPLLLPLVLALQHVRQLVNPFLQLTALLCVSKQIDSSGSLLCWIFWAVTQEVPGIEVGRPCNACSLQCLWTRNKHILLFALQ